MITYNKEFRKKDGRLLTASGPRALQNRPAYNDDDITSLKEEIARLKSIVSSGNNVTSNITHDNIDINYLINGAVSKALLEVETSNIAKIQAYEDKIAVLNREVIILSSDLEYSKKESHTQVTSYEDRLYILFKTITQKDEVIKDMTDKLISSNVVVMGNNTEGKTIVSRIDNNNRPAIDKVFIDPSKKGVENDMTSHVRLKEVVNGSNINVGESVDKLKSLMGKLPNR